MNNINDTYKLLEIVANSMNCKIVYWKTLDEVVEKNIIISRIVDADSYINDNEYKKLNDKSWVGK